MATTFRSGLLALYDGVGSAATYTSNVAAQGGFPLSRLQTTAIASATRLAVGSLSNVQITIDLGAALSLNVFMLAGTNLTLAATRRFQASTVSNFASTVIDTGAVLLPAFDTTYPRLPGASGVSWAPRWGWPLIFVNSASVTARYLRWTITDAANPDNYLRFAIGRAGLGWQQREGYNFAPGWSTVDAAKNLRGHRLTYHRLNQPEKSQVTSLCRSLETFGRVLVIPEPLNTASWLEDALWARVESVLEVQHVARKLFSVEITFREVDE